MYKKINGYIVAGVCSFCNVAFGMEQEKNVVSFGIKKNIHWAVEQEKCLRKLQTGKVPVLALNDYIVNVSSAYRALKKEACLERDMFRFMIKAGNKEMRRICSKQGTVYRMRDTKTCKRVTDYTELPYFTNIDIAYKNVPDCRNKFNAHITMDTLVYRVSPLFFKSTTYWKDKYITQSYRRSLYNNVHRLVPKGKPVFIEFYCPDKVSDWIRIDNNLNSINPAARAQLARKDSSLFHERDLDYDSINKARIKICSCSFVVVTTMLSAVVLGLSFL